MVKVSDSKKSKRRSSKKQMKKDLVEIFKREICSYFGRYIKSEKITQAELGRKLGLHKGSLSKIVNIQTEEFTLDRLLRFFNVIHPELILVIKKSSKAKKKKRKKT